MSFDGRRRHIKIVEQAVGKNEEIMGGLKNALDRGATIEQAKNSFVNAGYKVEEVEAAIQKVPSIMSRVSKPLVSPKGDERDSIQGPSEKVKEPVFVDEDKKEQKKQASPILTIALIIMTILVVGGGAAMYFFKDKLFP